MQVYLALDPRLPLSATIEYARRAERLGFDGLHVPETVHDSLAVALLALEHTSNLVVRSAITLAFVRSPTAIAYAAWDLATFSGGRFELGLGTQIKQNIEGRYGMPWSEPVARMRDYLGALHALFASFSSGVPLHHDGAHYRLTRLQPYFNPGPNSVAAPRIWLGGINARMCELAGELTSGVITHSTNSESSYLREVVRPALDRGAVTATDPPSRAPDIIVSPPIAVGSTDADVRRERERQRKMLAFLYSTPSYATALARRGHPGLQAELAALTREQRWDDLPAVLGDDLLDEVVIAGRYEQLPDLIGARYGDLTRRCVLPPLQDDGDAAIAACVDALHTR